MGHTGRQNQCQVCREYGHNRRGCPESKAAAEKVQKLLEKYDVQADCKTWGISEWTERLLDKIVDSHDELNSHSCILKQRPAEYVSYWEASRWQEIGQRASAKEWNKEHGRQRRCGFCGQPGHNRRKCENQEQHKLECRAMKALAHRVARLTFEKSGVVPGALLQYRTYDYTKREYITQIGMLQSINWQVIGEQDATDSSGLNYTLERWIFRNNPLKMMDASGTVRDVSIPRNITHQTDYYCNMDDDNAFRLLAPVLGSSVNLDGYTGDSEFPVRHSIWMWGKKWVDKQFGRQVAKLLKASGVEIRK